MKSLSLMLNLFISIPKKIALGLIFLYQKITSPDHSEWGKIIFKGGYCQYHPSCSEYAKQSIQKRGLIRGAFKSFWRILKCNPWSKGGEDLP